MTMSRYLLEHLVTLAARIVFVFVVRETNEYQEGF